MSCTRYLTLWTAVQVEAHQVALASRRETNLQAVIMKMMLKLSVWALLCAHFLGVAYAQEGVGGPLGPGGSVITELSPLPAEPRFDQIVTFSTGLGGAPLPVMIEALAQAIGLTAVVENVPDKSVTYNLGDKPFRQIWKIVLSLNGLDYVLLENNVVVVGDSEAISRFNQREPILSPEIDQRFYKVSGNPADFASAVRAAVPMVVVDVIPSINTLSVRGIASQQQRVAAILSELDPPETHVNVTPREQRIYRLSNAKAVEIAAVLQETGTVKDDVVVGEGEGAAPVASKDFAVVADERTNTLIINATPEQHAQFAKIIPALDIPQKQINVQIRIQEITQTVRERLGVNPSLGVGNVTAQLLSSTGLSFVFDAQRAISGLNIGAVLDAYERQGLTRRVDDSTLTVLNNGQGVLQSGGILTVVPAQVTLEADAALETIEVPYGVQITVQPRVSNDGRIIMAIQARVEDLKSTTDSSRIERTTNNVETLVTLEPGQTILLGGLFHELLKENVNGVPILSSLPLVGNFFKTTTIEEDESELLLVVTADVVE